MGRSLETTYLERLDWLIRLHVTAGLALWGAAVAQNLLAPMPGGLIKLSALFAGLLGAILWAAREVRRWRRTRFVAIETFYRGGMNTLATIDLAVLLLGTHFGGGVDSPALDFIIVPLLVYGSFLPRRDVYVHAGVLAVLLGGLLSAHSAGWLPRACPPIPGYVCAAGSSAFAWSRYLATIALAWVATYLTVYLGSSLQAQEERAREVAREWEQVATLRAQFVAHASHEFRTPLAVILATANSLRRYADRLTPAQRNTKLDKIEGTIQQMSALLDSVLLLGRAEAGVVAVSREAVTLHAFGQQLLAELAPLASTTHQLDLDVRLDDPIGWIDPTLLRQVLGNLLSNAVKFSPDGGRVALTVRRDPDQLRFDVSDQGVGIAPSERARILQPFYRAAEMAQTPGAGLGLAIAQRAVELMDGTLIIDAAPAGGTRVTVRVPEQPRAAGRAAAQASAGGSR